MASYEERQAARAAAKAAVLERFPDAREVYLGPKTGTVVAAGTGATLRRLCTAFGTADAWIGAAAHLPYLARVEA